MQLPVGGAASDVDVDLGPELEIEVEMQAFHGGGVSSSFFCMKRNKIFDQSVKSCMCNENNVRYA